MDGCVLTLVGFHTLGQAFYCGKSNISNKVHKSPPTQNEALTEALTELWALTCFVLLLPLREDQVNNKNCCTPSGSVHLFLWCSFIYLALALFLIPLSLSFHPHRAGLSRLPHSSVILKWTSVFLPKREKTRLHPALISNSTENVCESVCVCVLGWILGAGCSGWDTLSLCRNSIACRAAAGAGCVALFITNTQALCIPHTHTFPALKHTLLLPIDASIEHLIVFHVALG